MARRTVAAIATVYNEEASIAALLTSLIGQSRAPDEIIITDAGSTDQTRAIIEEFIAGGLPARLIVAPGANRARGRNLAVEQASSEIIASIDGGCQAHGEWLARLVAPFEGDDPPDVVGGYYQPDAVGLLQQAIAAATVPGVEEVSAAAFLPSSRSVAFTRAAWERVGGYPEEVAFAEDTAFGLRLRRAGCRFAFAPAALVRWRMTGSLRGVFRQFRQYARSDGELGHWFGHYRKAYLGLYGVLVSVLLWLWLGRAGPILLGILALAYWWRHAARTRRRGVEWPVALLAPLANLVVDAAHVVGYTEGRLEYRPTPDLSPASRPLSIAQLTYTYRPIAGGADVYVDELARMIAAAGHRCTVYQRGSGAGGDAVRFVPNPWRGLPFEFWTHALGLVRLWRELRTYDLVICHYPHYLLALDLVSWFGGRPVRVGISHGVFWDDAPGSLRSTMKAALAWLAFRRAHLYVANDTHFLRAMGLPLPPRMGLHARVRRGVWLIPNGVDHERFRPRPGAPKVNAVLVPRNLYRNRGVHLAIEAFAAFRRQYPGTTLLVVGGGGEPRYLEELKRLIEELAVGDSVMLYGLLPHDQMAEAYTSCQLTLIPSLCGEGTSLSALESMACGTATICTYVAGLRDLPGPHALPLATDLASVMLQVYPDRARVGDQQRREVLAHYTIQRWREAWARALGEAAGWEG